MKKKYFLTINSMLCTLILCGCQTAKELVQHQYPTKVVTPTDPYIDGNITVVNERVTSGVERTADAAAKAVTVPKTFVKKFIDSSNGISTDNPYDREDPYYRKDFQQDMMADSMLGVTQPRYLRGAQYAQALRSPFIFKEELLRGGTSEAATVPQVSASMMAKQYLTFQKDIEAQLDKAEELYNENRYSEALEIVDKVMDLDTSSRKGRILFEKIIKAREEDRVEREEKMRERLAQNEKIEQYLSQAQDYLAGNDLEEALRIAKKALSLNASHERAREVVDTIELAKFEQSIKKSGMTSFEVLERMIYKHLKLYQQYSNENLTDLAEKELRKVAVLEEYRDRLSLH